jgi:peptidoglycan/LPS O-acetylase OafA/YrhL
VRRIPQLDGLRALAVALVVLDHSVTWFPGGGIGVDVFFVLSGFLITSLLAGETEKFGHVSRGRFYLRRALRLFPALLAMLLVTPILVHVSAEDVALAATYTSNLAMAFWHQDAGVYGHTWSLALEEQFYLLWPLALPFVLKLRTRQAVGLLMALALASAVVAQARVHTVVHDGAVGVGVFNPLWQAHGLLIGCALALALRARRDQAVVAPIYGWAALGACLVVAAGASATVDHHWAALWNLAAELAAAVLIAVLARSDGASISRLFAYRPIVWVGERSYAIYLWHVPLIAFAEAHGPRPLSTAVGVGGAVVASALSWRFVEAPFLRLKDRFHAKAPAETAPAPALGAVAAPAANTP